MWGVIPHVGGVIPHVGCVIPHVGCVIPHVGYNSTREDIDASYFASYLVWLDETGVNRRDSLRRMGYSIRGHTPVSQKLMARGKVFCLCLYVNRHQYALHH